MFTMFFFFFFQAEDGIRDYKVTGVQTCALPILVDHAARHDELVVAADEREQLAAVAPEHIEVAEGISHVSNVARAVLRHRRILVDADGAPVEVQVMLVPVELRDPEEERSRPVQRRQVRVAIEPEPDALAILVAWAVP